MITGLREAIFDASTQLGSEACDAGNHRWISEGGRRWEGYYYDGRDETGNRKEIPLGTDLNEAKRKWAELECRPAPVETRIMSFVFDRYAREIIPEKAPK